MPEDWQNLGSSGRYALDVTQARRRSSAYTCPDWNSTWLIPDYQAIAADFDAIHLTVAGYVLTAGRALPSRERTNAAGRLGPRPDLLAHGHPGGIRATSNLEPPPTASRMGARSHRLRIRSECSAQPGLERDDEVLLGLRVHIELSGSRRTSCVLSSRWESSLRVCACFAGPLEGCPGAFGVTQVPERLTDSDQRERVLAVAGLNRPQVRLADSLKVVVSVRQDVRQVHQRVTRPTWPEPEFIACQ